MRTSRMRVVRDGRWLLEGHGWFKENAAKQTHLVGKKKPNAWRLYDMHGKQRACCCT